MATLMATYLVAPEAALARAVGVPGFSGEGSWPGGVGVPGRAWSWLRGQGRGPVRAVLRRLVSPSRADRGDQSAADGGELVFACVQAVSRVPAGRCLG